MYLMKSVAEHRVAMQSELSLLNVLLIVRNRLWKADGTASIALWREWNKNTFCGTKGWKCLGTLVGWVHH